MNDALDRLRIETREMQELGQLDVQVLLEMIEARAANYFAGEIDEILEAIQGLKPYIGGELSEKCRCCGVATPQGAPAYCRSCITPQIKELMLFGRLRRSKPSLFLDG